MEEKVVFPISPATFSDLLLIALKISKETHINFHFGANFQTDPCVSHAWSNNEISRDRLLVQNLLSLRMFPVCYAFLTTNFIGVHLWWPFLFILDLYLIWIKEFGPGHMLFFNRKYYNGVNEGLSWFEINLMVSFQDITQNMFCNLAKISHPADLEIF